MVDHAIFVDLGGAKQAMRTIQMVTNNLANANTYGFQADFETVLPSHNDEPHKMQSRAHVAGKQSYSDFTQGPILATGRELDVAIDGPGFIAVQTKEGKVGYTRAGSLNIAANGVLTTSKGDIVLGDKGVINIPKVNRVHISEHGIVTAQLPGESENQLTHLGQIKLVKLPLNQIQKGIDGLFYLKENANVPATPPDAVSLIPKALEGSNVNPMHALAELIDVSRNFEMHTKLMSVAEENASAANQLLNLTK